MGVNWPELRSCFGLCSLKKGVYIVASIGMVLNALSIVGYCVVFTDLVIKRRDIFKDKDLWKEQNLSDARSTLAFWTHILLGYIFTWVILNLIIFITNAILFYGMRKNRRNLMKMYLYVNFQTWILTVVNAIIISQFFNIFIKLLVVVYALLDGYKLLVVRSAYREMTGKQKFLDSPNINVSQTVFESPPQYTPSPNSSGPLHCSSCLCNAPDNTEVLTSNNNTSINNTENTIPKEINFKENTIIFNSNLTTTVNDVVLNNNNRETQSEEEVTVCKKEQENNEDTIYDENQLNVGFSPICEEIPVITNDKELRNHITIQHPRILYENKLEENYSAHESIEIERVGLGKSNEMTLDNVRSPNT